jgi:hypothetical protein
MMASSVFPVSDAHCSASASVYAFRACRARLSSYRQSVHEVLIAFYEAITERVLSRTYALQAYPEYRAFFLALLSSRSGLLPSLPLPLPNPFSPLPDFPLRVPLPLLLPFSPASDRPPALVLVVFNVLRQMMFGFVTKWCADFFTTEDRGIACLRQYLRPMLCGIGCLRNYMCPMVVFTILNSIDHCTVCTLRI